MNRLLGLLVFCGMAFWTVPALAQCDPSCVTCSGPTAAECTSCAAGSWLNGNPGSCVLCTSVNHCLGALTCTAATNSQCSLCQVGFFLDGSGPADTCTPCTAIPNCVGSVTCTTASNSQCSACPSGFYLDETGPSDACSLCSTIDGCISPITCSSATTSQCTQCATGRYVSDGVADTCPTCTAVDHCVAPVTCTTGGDSTCSLCQSGFFSDQVGPSTICTHCTDVIGCISPTTCTTVSDSQCTACDAGHYLSEGLADMCPECTPIANCTSLTCTNGSNSQCTSCAAPTVDDFNCYKVKDLKVPPFVRTGVSVADQFATSPVTLIKPALLCAPAGVDGSSVANSQTHLCCYKSKAAKLPAPVRAEVTDQLGPRQVEVKQSSLVCEPCSKALLP